MVRNTQCCFTGGSKLRSFSYLALVVLVALLGSARVAAAANASPSDPAKAALEQARRAEAANRSGEAIEALKRAYELSGDGELLFRLGELTRKSGQEVPALRFYRAYLTREPRGKHRPIAERQARLLESREPKLAAPMAAPPSGSLSFPPPAGASPPGQWQPEKVPVGAATGSAAGAGSPNAGAQGTAPLALATTPPPMTENPSSPSVDLRAQSAPIPEAVIEPPLPRWVPWTGLAATLALGAGATVSGISASHRHSELQSSCGSTAAGCSKADVDDLRSRARTTTLLWVGAGVMAAATGVSVYFNTREAGISGIWRF
jgi:hypothetical protein